MWTDKSKSRAIKEWVIFAVCMGLGGHIALALLLHAPADQWPDRAPWFYVVGFSISLSFSVYVGVQLIRSVWWFVRGERSEEAESQDET